MVDVIDGREMDVIFRCLLSRMVDSSGLASNINGKLVLHPVTG